MSKFYRNYIWKGGIPYGIEALEGAVEVDSGVSYKIAMDPYRKRISLEKYENSVFLNVIYDSALFDFRHLKPMDQMAWQKVTVNENSDSMTSHIRNQDDRLILIETYRFEKDLCKDCFAKSPHGIPISHQKIYYTKLGDPFNGVILYDMNEHPVLFKHYEIDKDTGDFTIVIKEQWDMSEATYAQN